MSFWKRLFGIKEQQPLTSFLEYLQAIEQLLKPSINPLNHQYKEALLRNDFTFQVNKHYTREQMQQQTWLSSVKYVKRKQQFYIWRAPIRELREIQGLEKTRFADQFITPVVDKLKATQQDIEHFDSVIEYEETVKNIYHALHDSVDKHGGDAVWEKSKQLLQKVSKEVQKELQQEDLHTTTQLLEQLEIEEKYMNRHK